MSKTDEDSPRSKLPIGGIVVLVLVGGAVLFFTATDQSWNPFSGASSTAQAMELSGSWLGMRLTASNTPTAQAMGIPQGVDGVVVSDLVLPDAARVQQAGIVTGDVITNIDGNAVPNLTELYTLSTTLDVQRPVPVVIVRQGQPLQVILPGPNGELLPPGAAGAVGPAAPSGTMPPVAGAMPGVAGAMPAVGPMPHAHGATPAQPGANAPMLYCPNDRLYWTQAQVGPGGTCPRCGGSLAR